MRPWTARARTPRIFEDAGDLRSVDRVRVPTDSDLGRDRHRRDGANNRLRYRRQGGAIFEQGRAAVLCHHLVDGAAKIQIDKIGPNPINDMFRGFRHVFRISAKELHPDGPLAFVEIEIFPRPFISPEHAFGRNELRDEDVRPALFAELAENLVRNAGHRRQIERKTGWRKPGKGGIHHNYCSAFLKS